MSFTKYVSLIDRKQQFFQRGDQFQDPYEGSLPRENVENRPDFYEQLLEEENLEGEEVEAEIENLHENMADVHKKSRKHHFLNCWHKSDFESDAMWNLYDPAGKGIAIQSTIGNLKEAFEETEETIFMGEIDYIDYDSEEIPEGTPTVPTSIIPFFYKRKSFEHEKEVRAIISKVSEAKRKAQNKGEEGLYDWLDLPVKEGGLYVDVNLESLVEKVFVAPYTEDWILELGQSVTEKYQFSFEVNRSDLIGDPHF